jgi:hypothetical protein
MLQWDIFCLERTLKGFQTSAGASIAEHVAMFAAAMCSYMLTRM